MAIVLSEYYSEQSMAIKAQVCRNDDGAFFIKYVKNEEVFKTEMFPGKSEQYVEDAAENWALGIKVLSE